MPKDNIERAIAKGTGEGADADALEAVLYEGYGPGGVALLIEALTDNRNRTGSEIRHLFSKHGGNLGEPGSVAYLFDKQRARSSSTRRGYAEDDLMPAIDAGALRTSAIDDDVFEVRHRARGPYRAVRGALEGAERGARERRGASSSPKTRVPVDEDGAPTRLLRLIDALEDNDDVNEVHGNFDVDAAVLERVAG